MCSDTIDTHRACNHPGGTPKEEVRIDLELVRCLLGEQHPDLLELPVGSFESGWDNALFRLGERLILRLPRRALAADLIHHEQKWLPHLAPSLPLPVSCPSRSGSPGCGYPWSWSVVPWLAGRAADLAEPMSPLWARYPDLSCVNRIVEISGVDLR